MPKLITGGTGSIGKEWGWQPAYDTLEKILEDLMAELRLHPHRYGLK